MKKIISISAVVFFLMMPALALAQSKDLVEDGSVTFGFKLWDTDMAVMGNYVYLTNQTPDLLQGVDVSNPASPALTGSASTGVAPDAIALQGNYAYVINANDATLQVFDISNPASPVSVGTVSTGGVGDNPDSVAVSGNYAYVTNSNDYTLRVFDISSHASPPTQVSDTSTGWLPFQVVVQGNYAYVPRSNKTLEVFNIANPASPTMVGVVTIGTPNETVVQGNYLYIINQNVIQNTNTLQIIDISNPASPTTISTTAISSFPTSLAVSGNYAYVTSDSSSPTVQVFDISNPVSPVLVNVTPFTNPNFPDVIRAQGNYVYLTVGSNVLEVLQLVDSPTCNVTLSPNPSPYAYSGTPVTLTWSSSNATDVYINNVGWVSASGSTQVGSQQTTDYSCYAYNSTNNLTGPTTTAMLTVNAPPNPSATINASSTSITVGESTNLTATFAAGSGDMLTGDNIDEPLGVGQGADTSPGSKSIVFTPSAPGTYTFYARATTGFYQNWTTYASTIVQVAPQPWCSVTLNPSTISAGQSSTLTYSSTNASSFSIATIGPVTPNITSSVQVSPTQTTDYTGTVASSPAGFGFQNTCPAELTVACTPQYTCGGSDGETIIYTDSSCNDSVVTDCQAPSFCTPNSSTCLYPPIDVISHLHIVPSLSGKNNTVQVFWNVNNVQDCTVTGTNGDSWTGDASPSNGATSSPIVGETTYTLSCSGYSGGAVPYTLSENQNVNLVPSYQEP